MTQVEPCIDCRRPTRRARSSEADFPGTVVARGRGLCSRCYVKRKKSGTPMPPKHEDPRKQPRIVTNCHICKRPVRPYNSKITEFPGAARQVGGYCMKCKNKGKNKPPTVINLPRVIQPDWRDSIVCKNVDTDMFFDTKHEEKAKRICQQCPVKDMCLASAMVEEAGYTKWSRWGIYGGLTPIERVRLASVQKKEEKAA